jgi:hypothetical protein
MSNGAKPGQAAAAKQSQQAPKNAPERKPEPKPEHSSAVKNLLG